ncbi:MAG: hypothetical protein HQM15_11730 [Deltaproteobacteria bacterium]|nr:hypothetical protein [Deltaproteobacteria bacterium]
MQSQLKEKVKEMHIGKNLKEGASALGSDIKAMGRDAKKVAGEAVEHVRKGTKEVLQKAEKKLS